MQRHQVSTLGVYFNMCNKFGINSSELYSLVSHDLVNLNAAISELWASYGLNSMEYKIAFAEYRFWDSLLQQVNSNRLNTSIILIFYHLLIARRMIAMIFNYMNFMNIFIPMFL